MKKVILFAVLMISMQQLFSQSFFKPEKKPTQKMMAKLGATGTVAQNVIRPVANIASITEPGNIGLSGVGISWQHQEWSDPDQKWKVLYSINALTWYSTTNTVYYGIAGGVLNNLLLIGIATDNGKHFIGTIGVGININ